MNHLQLEEHSATPLGIHGEFNIYTAGEWRDRLSEVFAQTGDVRVDLSEVTEIDTAGLQLLIAARFQAEKEAREFILVNYSQPVINALDFCRLSDFFLGNLLLPAAQRGNLS